MSFWNYMEYGAWGLSAVFGLYIVIDWLKTDATPAYSEEVLTSSREGELEAMVENIMAEFDITAKGGADGMGPHGTQVEHLLRVLGPAHVWALGVSIVLVGEYMGWNFSVGKGGAYAALIACWLAGIALLLRRHDRL